ncbi:MAG: hypothetical protein JWR74_857 [Polaromonas sp.]|nr:hypothetical protein [Polaromonas sp.]
MGEMRLFLLWDNSGLWRQLVWKQGLPEVEHY